MKGIRTLTYCPELNKITGSITASLLLAQLEYWFSKKKGQGFYKFLAPCEHEHYKEGDSWTEELAFSKAEFRHAFSQIGTVYKSKTAYLKSEDPFQGKMYLSYYDRIRKITVYERNHQRLQGILKTLPSYIKENKNTKDPDKDETSYTDQQSECGINKDYKKQSLQQRVTTDKVIEIYHTHCPSLPKVEKVTNKHKGLMNKLWELVKGDVDTIKQVFAKIEASDFLCGRLKDSTWKSYFEWIITTENFLKIKDGRYDTYKKEKAQSAFLRTYTHNFDLEKLEELEFKYRGLRG